MFPGVTVPQAEAGKAAAAGGLLTNVAAIANPLTAGLALAGGLSSMFGGGSGSGMETSSAVSGGTFTTGDFGGGKSETITTVVIIAGIVLGFVLIFKGKK